MIYLTLSKLKDYDKPLNLTREVVFPCPLSTFIYINNYKYIYRVYMYMKSVYIYLCACVCVQKICINIEGKRRKGWQRMR